jgi:hypothetical protein
MILAYTVAMAVAQATPSPTPTAATNAADAAATARAKDWLHQIQAGKVDRAQLTSQMNTALTEAKLGDVSAQLAPLGDPTAFTLAQKFTRGTLTIYVFTVQFASITATETLALDQDGKIAGLYIVPKQ